MNCIIVDDDKMARHALSMLVKEVDFLTLKQECDSALSAFNFINKEKVDLVFLDIEMPEMSGIELVRNLKKAPIIIFCTSNEKYAVEAFELNVADFIVKPYSRSRFITAVSRAKELFDSRKQEIEMPDKEYVFIRSNSLLTKLMIRDINYVQALGDYVNIYTAEKRHTVHMTLKAIEEKLSPDMFYRVHRSYLINLDKVDFIEKETAYVAGQPVPIGEQNKSVLLKKLNLL